MNPFSAGSQHKIGEFMNETELTYTPVAANKPLDFMLTIS